MGSFNGLEPDTTKLLPKPLILLMELPETYLSEISNKIPNFEKENALENVGCKMLVILVKTHQLHLKWSEWHSQWWKYLRKDYIFTFWLKFTFWVEAPISSLCVSFVLWAG